MNLDSGFLEHPATKWETLKSYRKGKHVASNLPVVNNTVERALGLAVDANIKIANAKVGLFFCVKKHIPVPSDIAIAMLLNRIFLEIQIVKQRTM